MVGVVFECRLFALFMGRLRLEFPMGRNVDALLIDARCRAKSAHRRHRLETCIERPTAVICRRHPCLIGVPKPIGIPWATGRFQCGLEARPAPRVRLRSSSVKTNLLRLWNDHQFANELLAHEISLGLREFVQWVDPRHQRLDAA